MTRSAKRISDSAVSTRIWGRDLMGTAVLCKAGVRTGSRWVEANSKLLTGTTHREHTWMECRDSLRTLLQRQGSGGIRLNKIGFFPHRSSTNPKVVKVRGHHTSPDYLAVVSFCFGFFFFYVFYFSFPFLAAAFIRVVLAPLASFFLHVYRRCPSYTD